MNRTGVQDVQVEPDWRVAQFPDAFQADLRVRGAYLPARERMPCQREALFATTANCPKTANLAGPLSEHSSQLVSVEPGGEHFVPLHAGKLKDAARRHIAVRLGDPQREPKGALVGELPRRPHQKRLAGPEAIGRSSRREHTCRALGVAAGRGACPPLRNRGSHRSNELGP